MKLDTQFFSQYSDAIAVEWQSKVCAIACTKMILDFYGKENESMKLVEEGLLISKKLVESGKPLSGYTPGFGWGHDVLVFLLAQHGVPAYRQEFRVNNTFVQLGIEKIKKQIQTKKPTMISIAKDIKNPKTSGHLVLIVGYEEEEGIIKGFYMNDPEKKNETEGKDIFVDIESFLLSWKKLAIFVE